MEKFATILLFVFSFSSGSVAENKIICEHEGARNISCPLGAIRIDDAYYGRTQPEVNCIENSDINDCISKKSRKLINEKCTAKKYCELNPSNDVFGDPCPNKYKYINVTYTCIVATTAAVTTRTTQTTVSTIQTSGTITTTKSTTTSQKFDLNTTAIATTTTILQTENNVDVELILGITLPLIALCAIGAVALLCVIKRQTSGGSVEKLDKNHDDIVTSVSYVNATDNHDSHAYEETVYGRDMVDNAIYHAEPEETKEVVANQLYNHMASTSQNPYTFGDEAPGVVYHMPD